MQNWLIPNFLKGAHGEVKKPVEPANAANGKGKALNGEAPKDMNNAALNQALIDHLDDDTSSDSDNEVKEITKDFPVKTEPSSAKTQAIVVVDGAGEEDEEEELVEPEVFTVEGVRVFTLGEFRYARAQRETNYSLLHCPPSETTQKYRSVPIDVLYGLDHHGNIMAWWGFESKDCPKRSNNYFNGYERGELSILRKDVNGDVIFSDLIANIEENHVQLPYPKAGDIIRVDHGAEVGLWEQLSSRLDPDVTARLNDPHAPSDMEVATLKMVFTLKPKFFMSRKDGTAGYNSKKKTGMVGLENLGATCYLNALLQMLYHINHFREAVYQIPHKEEENIDDSVTFNLQSVFRSLQIETSTVTTKDLTKAFGWTTAQAYMQQDAQEMMRVLLEKLEEKMAKTPVEGTVDKLFSGRLKSYIRCIDVDFESSREEDFSDVQLDVKNCNDIYESFHKYVEKERLDGENQYDAGPQLGKQDAEKGAIFLEFPPVLTIQLKRFDFDLQRMCFVKVHDEYRFPDQLDVSEFLAKSEDIGAGAGAGADAGTNGDSGGVNKKRKRTAEEEEDDKCNTYLLHSVLVHRGDVGGGHYYAYIRPHGHREDDNDPNNVGKLGDWHRFNDERVLRVSEREAVKYNYGRSEINDGTASAYMLVYLKESYVKRIMRPVDSESVSRSVLGNIEKKKKARLQQEAQQNQSQLYANFSYFQEEQVAKFVDYAIRYELVNPRDLQSVQLFKEGASFNGLLFALLKKTGRLLCHLRMFECGRHREGGYSEPALILKKVMDAEYSVEIQNPSDPHGPPVQSEMKNDFMRALGNHQVVYLDNVDASDWATKLDVDVVRTSQEALLARDIAFMKTLEEALGQYIPGLGEAGFDCIKDNCALTSWVILKRLKAAGCPQEKVEELQKEKKEISLSWSTILTDYYGQSNTMDEVKDDACLLFVKAYDSLHRLPMCEERMIPPLEGLDLPVLPDSASSTAQRQARTDAQDDILPVKYLGSGRFSVHTKLIDIAKHQLGSKLVSPVASSGNGDSGGSGTSQEDAVELEGDGDKEVSDWQLVNKSRVIYYLQKGPFLWDSATYLQNEAVNEAMSDDPHAQHQQLPIDLTEANDLTLRQALFLFESDNAGHVVSDFGEGFSLVVEVVDSDDLYENYRDWYAHMGQRTAAILRPFDDHETLELFSTVLPPALAPPIVINAEDGIKREGAVSSVAAEPTGDDADLPPPPPAQARKRSHTEVDVEAPLPLPPQAPNKENEKNGATTATIGADAAAVDGAASACGGKKPGIDNNASGTKPTPAGGPLSGMSVEVDRSHDDCIKCLHKLILRINLEREANGMQQMSNAQYRHFFMFVKLYVSWSAAMPLAQTRPFPPKPFPSLQAMLHDTYTKKDNQLEIIRDLEHKLQQQQHAHLHNHFNQPNPYYNGAADELAVQLDAAKAKHQNLVEEAHGIAASINESVITLDNHFEACSYPRHVLAQCGGRPTIYYRRSPVRCLTEAGEERLHHGRGRCTIYAAINQTHQLPVEVTVVDARIRRWRKLYLSNLTDTGKAELLSVPAKKRQKSKGDEEEEGEGEGEGAVVWQSHLYLPPTVHSVFQVPGVTFPADYRLEDSRSKWYDPDYPLSLDRVNIVFDTMEVRTVAAFTHALHAQLGMPLHLHPPPPPAAAAAAATATATAEVEVEVEVKGMDMAAIIGQEGATGDNINDGNSSPSSSSDKQKAQARRLSNKSAFLISETPMPTVLTSEEGEGEGMVVSKYPPFPLMVFTIESQNMRVRLLSPHLSTSSQPLFTAPWFDASSEHDYHSSRITFTAVQHVSLEEERLMRNNHPDFSSMTVLVFSFTLLGSGAKPLPFDDLDTFPKPFLTYVSQQDTYDDLCRRIGCIAGEEDTCLNYRLAVIKNKQPNFILRSKARAATPSRDFEPQSQSQTVAASQLTAAADDREQAGGGLVWRNFQDKYAHNSTMTLDALLKEAGPSVLQDGSWTPPYLGIQRSASSTSTSKRAGESGRSNIKIA